MKLTPSHEDHPLHEEYCERVAELEADGLCTSDAQGVADYEFEKLVKQ